jgi:hypothetical protein
MCGQPARSASGHTSSLVESLAWLGRMSCGGAGAGERVAKERRRNRAAATRAVCTRRGLLGRSQDHAGTMYKSDTPIEATPPPTAPADSAVTEMSPFEFATADHSDTAPEVRN